jgi:ribosomal protein S18 acetylase RimI-like enzyme
LIVSEPAAPTLRSPVFLMPPSSLIARNGERLDVARLWQTGVAALQRFNAELSEHTRSVFLPHAYDTATLARCAERDRTDRDRTYVLRRGQEVVGYFFLWEFDQPVPIAGLGLADAWQGQGLGNQMLELLIADARAAARAAIELTTVPGNQRAFGLYRRAGFVHVGEVENVAGDGRIVREHRMFLALRPDAQPQERHFKPPE